MNCDEAIEYIHSIPKFMRPLGNEKLGALLARLGNPHKDGKFIHIAGTNGKGSVAAMLTQILAEQGYKTGMFTSPFIEVFNERIQINNELISDADLAEYASRVRRVMEESGDYVSEFAFITATAFLYFKEQNCDYVVLETGLGGRYDATNIIERPPVSVITAIGYDHMQFLGDTIEEIAEEKCGIIKSDCPVVSQPNTAVCGIIERRAAEMNAPLTFTAEPQTADGGMIYKGRHYALSLKGGYQLANAAEVIETVGILRRAGVEISDVALINGLAHTRWQARFECVADNIIIDGAHNIDGIRALKKSLAELNTRYVIVIAMMRDKAAAECMREIAGGADAVIATEIDMPRCESAANLAAYTNAVCEPNFRAAIERGIKAAAGGTLCICGSLYFAAEARKYILIENPQEYSRISKIFNVEGGVSHAI